jgi:hypothetical protein
MDEDRKEKIPWAVDAIRVNLLQQELLHQDGPLFTKYLQTVQFSLSTILYQKLVLQLPLQEDE